MKSNQSWIKYFGIALGLVLALGIISMIVNGGIFVINSLGLVDNKSITHNDSSGSFNKEYSESLENMKINFNAGDLTIQSGDKFTIGGSGLTSDLSIKVTNGTLIIEDSKNFNFFGNLFGQTKARSLVITIPKGIILNGVDLEIGAGRGEITDLAAREINITQGAGELAASNIQADSGSLSGGAGAVNFENVKLNNFDIKSGVGLVKIAGQLTGKFKLDCGVGQTILNINGNPQDYFINADQGLGPITVNGLGISENGTGPRTASNSLDINGGVGSVEINFIP
ncbi:DUF4097 family beta strand repeat-containing protein [Acetobacterium sp.]|uniref:DUF4097 family beta strand repeat-containing protein n=1 Tax=Acetobacterium sp. TaxID=1872094 RepID=UPI002F3E2487